MTTMQQYLDEWNAGRTQREHEEPAKIAKVRAKFNQRVRWAEFKDQLENGPKGDE